MSDSNADFFVIYNRALSPMAETDDTQLSLRFTEDLVQFLEQDCGHIGHYGDRDARPGCNIFDELRRNINETRKTFLVVTQGFMLNCWATYCAQSAFKSLLDTNKSDKLIPIGIHISDSMQLESLNITEWIHFPRDWQDTTSQKWNIIRQVLTYDGPLSRVPTYQEYSRVLVQEHGDNRLRSEGQILVVQSTSLQSGEFLTDEFLMNLAKNFPGDWKILAIYLQLNDNTVTEHERNNPGSVRQQAYSALKCWQRIHVGPEKKKVEFLLSVLMEMGKTMLSETIEAEYKNYMQQAGSSSSLAAGGDVDEVDMGIFRRSNTGRILNQHQTDGRQSARRGQDSHSTGSPLLHTTNVTRELRTVTACIQAEPNADPLAAPISSNSVPLQQGPSMSLPPAPMLKLPNLEVSNETNRSRPEMEMYQLTSYDFIDGKDSGASDIEQFTGGSAGPDAMENLPVVNEHIASSAVQNQLMERNIHDNVFDAQTGSHNASDDVRSTRTNPHDDISYQNQHSLSEDDDLTADVNGTDLRQSVTDSSKSVTDSSKSITDSSKSVTDSSKSVTDSSKSNTDSSKSATDSSKSVTDSSKSVTDSSTSNTDSSKSATDSSKSITDSWQSITDSSKSITDSSKSITDSRQSITDSSKSITDSSKSITDSSKSVTDSSKSNTDSSKSNTDSSKSVTDSSKSNTDSSKSVTDSSKSITDSSKSATDSSKSVTDSSKSNTDSSKSVTDSSKSITDSSKSATYSSKSVTDSSKSITDSSKSNTDSSKSATDSSKSITDSSKSNTDFSKSNTDSSKSNTDSSKSATDCSKSNTDCSKSNTDSSKSATDSRPSVTDSRPSVTDSSKSITDSSKSATDSSKSATDSSKSNTDSSKSATDSRPSVTDSRPSVTDSSKSITDSSKSITDSSKSITDSSKSIADSSKSITDSSKSNNSSKSITDPSKSVTDSSKSVTDSRQFVTDSSKSSTYSSKATTDSTLSVTSRSEKPIQLDVHQREHGVPALNLDSLNAADTTPDSGYSCSDAETPVNDKIIPHESQLHHADSTLVVLSCNTEDESKGMNNVCQGEAEGETDLSSTNQTQNAENATQNGNQIDENHTHDERNRNQLGENRIQNGENNTQNGANRNQIGENHTLDGRNENQLGENRIQNGENNTQNGGNRDQFGVNKIQNGANRSQIGNESSVASYSSMNNSNAQHVSVDVHQRGAGNSVRQSGGTSVTQGASDASVPAQKGFKVAPTAMSYGDSPAVIGGGRPQVPLRAVFQARTGEGRSLVSLVVGAGLVVVGAVCSFWSRPEFAYS